jgi:predicted SnoaL-like aldol condensation-catalyzing enzyme
MSKTNKHIFEEFIEKVLNPQRFELIHEYLTEECVFHTPPYVGLGIMVDDTSGDKVLIQEIAPNSPAAAHLEEGDEVLKVSDDSGVRETFEQLKDSPWGQGKIGAPIELIVRREGKDLDVTFTRDRIEAFDTTLSENLEIWKHYMQNSWPDQKNEITLLVEEGDLVSYYMLVSGTNADYNQPAIWAECGIVRFKAGKITEWWSVEDGLSQFRQLGYRIKEPVKEAV